MNHQIALDAFTKLKLTGMAKVYQAVLSMPMQEQPSLHVFAARLVESEIQHRTETKTQLLLRFSKLRYHAVLENVHCGAHRNFTNENLLSLADCSFITQAKNVLITGATGCGKSYLACALGRRACTLGYKTQYFAMARFIEKIAQSKLDGTYIKFLNQLEKLDLLILDDFGLHPMTTEIRLSLLQILEDGYETKSIIITSQLPVAKWYTYIDDPTLADAIMDRLSVNANRIELKGDSLRKKN